MSATVSHLDIVPDIADKVKYARKADPTQNANVISISCISRASGKNLAVSSGPAVNPPITPATNRDKASATLRGRRTESDKIDPAHAAIIFTSMFTSVVSKALALTCIYLLRYTLERY